MLELLADTSELATASLVRPSRSGEPSDPVLTWRERFQAQVCPAQPHLFKALSFAQLQPDLDDLFPWDPQAAPRFLEYRDALWIRGSGALYDGRTGLALPGSYLTRFPRQRQTPTCTTFRVDLSHPLSALPRLERLVHLPFALCSNFGHFITETLGFLWPYLLAGSDAGREDLTGWPVLLSSCQGTEPSEQVLHALIRQRHGFPLLEAHLPATLHLERVLVPEPSLRLHASCTTTHIRAAGALGDWLLEQSAAPQEPTVAGRRLFISRSALEGEVRRVDQEPVLEALLAERGWTIFHPQQHSLAEQVAAYRSAQVISGFEGSALHGLALLGDAAAGPGLVLLGDNPSPDYFLQFRAQCLRGFFIQCTQVDPADESAEWVRRRLLLGSPDTLADLLDTLAEAF